MKKIISFVLVLSVVLSSLSAFAQSRRDDRRDDRKDGGTVVLRDGRSIVRIEVGDDRDDRDTLMRVRRLEQAVRDLQDKVYELQANSAPRTRIVTTHVCSVTTNFDGTFVGKASTRVEAEALARQKCQNQRVAFCTNANVTPARCEVVQEEVAY
ncbi:hypothetical protein [Peredibacter starrii]|uniref:Uncharacterized protein n=1 Tax=Peredibacter starrii TaxID=28202 RepID=A0AAX4HNG1_9BACT|nr:hypothetical protein [Peredibacter starrii]WPU64733.1 hypothetical protein SOO65_18735 [Peredibacter starrii]